MLVLTMSLTESDRVEPVVDSGIQHVEVDLQGGVY